MLRLGSVFSGIGSIEHALKRLSIEYSIEFACDSGNIELNSDRKEIEEKLLFFKDFKERKKYIDELFLKQKKKNFVKESYKENYCIPQENFHSDIRFLDGLQYRNKIDLFVGGSPCQSFSKAGNGEGFQDARGTLFYDFARLVDEIKPQVFIYENVDAVLNHDGGNTWDIMKKIFNNLGYKWFSQILNSKDYGIPQHRKRLFVIGFLDNSIKFEFPKPQSLTVTLQDFLMENTEEKFYLKNKEINSKRQIKHIATIEEKYFLSKKTLNYVMSTGTKSFNRKPIIDRVIANPLLATMSKMHRAGIDNYVTTQGRIRKLTPRECFRLMGFCDSFKIVVSDTQAYKQSGNSIVVDVLMSIVKQIYIANNSIIDDSVNVFEFDETG